jgi:hypothetical protein
MKNILIAARAKIADPANWVKDVLAVDANGDYKPSSHPLADDAHWEGLDGRDVQACQWCAMGAVQAVTTEVTEDAAFAALDIAAIGLYDKTGIVAVNDELGHAEVLACFDKAIKDVE